MDKEIQDYIHKQPASIISEHASMDLTYKGTKYTFNVGDKIGRLTIKALVKYRPISGESRKGCISLCECGSITGPSRLFQLISGDLVSCGCYCRDVHSKMMTKNNTIHGDNKRGQRERIYNIWAGMLQRCRSTDRKDSKHYSLKGISVCKEWETFTNFKKWALDNGYADGLTLDRVDNSIGYKPDNCRFVSMKEQQLNKSCTRVISYKGITDSVNGWAKRIGVSWYTLNARLEKSKSTGEALGFE